MCPYNLKLAQIFRKICANFIVLSKQLLKYSILQNIILKCFLICVYCNLLNELSKLQANPPKWEPDICDTLAFKFQVCTYVYTYILKNVQYISKSMLLIERTVFEILIVLLIGSNRLIVARYMASGDNRWLQQYCSTEYDKAIITMAQPNIITP